VRHGYNELATEGVNHICWNFVEFSIYSSVTAAYQTHVGVTFLAESDLRNKVLIDIEYVDIVYVLICIALAEDIIGPHHNQQLLNRTYIQKHCVF